MKQRIEQLYIILMLMSRDGGVFMRYIDKIGLPFTVLSGLASVYFLIQQKDVKGLVSLCIITAIFVLLCNANRISGTPIWLKRFATRWGKILLLMLGISLLLIAGHSYLESDSPWVTFSCDNGLPQVTFKISATQYNIDFIDGTEVYLAGIFGWPETTKNLDPFPKSIVKDGKASFVVTYKNGKPFADITKFAAFKIVDGKPTYIWIMEQPGITFNYGKDDQAYKYDFSQICKP